MVQGDHDERRSRSPGSHFSSSLGGSLSLITSLACAHTQTHLCLNSLVFPKVEQLLVGSGVGGDKVSG